MSACLPNPMLTIAPVARGNGYPALCCGLFFGVARWASDPVGLATVTFDGVHAGSEIRVYLPDGTGAAGVEDCSANHILSWGVYASGSANNTARVVIVHPAYKIKEFNYTASIGASSIPVQQEADKWYSNP